jgi:hypothetical protein
MSLNAEATVRINPTGRAEMHAAIAAGVTEVLTQDMWPAAVQGSPVKSGHNRRTIAVEVNSFGESIVNESGNGEVTEGVAVPTPTGVSAAIYSQSGYGGWLEIGTRKMTARPYIYPAVQRFLGRIGDAVRRRLER